MDASRGRSDEQRWYHSAKIATRSTTCARCIHSRRPGHRRNQQSLSTTAMSDWLALLRSSALQVGWPQFEFTTFGQGPDANAVWVGTFSSYSGVHVHCLGHSTTHEWCVSVSRSFNTLWNTYLHRLRQGHTYDTHHVVHIMTYTTTTCTNVQLN